MASNPNTDICMAAAPEDHRPMQRPYRRRKVKGGGGQKKKTPQRGMGVAQLEQLRVQEWKKMANFPVASSFVDPTPVQFPKLGGFGAAPNIGVGKMGLGNPNERVLSFNGQVGFGGFVSDYHFQPDLFDAVSWNPNVMKSCSPLCIACQEKKNISGQNLSCCGMKHEFNGCGFLGLNVRQNTHNFKRENLGFPTKVLRPEPNIAYTVRNSQPGVEVVTLHKKGPSTSCSEPSGDSLVMEYEFFPSGKGMKSNTMMKLMAAEWDQEYVNDGDDRSAALSNNTTGKFEGSAGSVDLSLKLSY